MSSELAEPPRWPARRWWMFVALIFATQLALIFWLGRAPRRPAPLREFAPQISFTGTNAARFLAYRDPTLFALPHQEGFSGLAWLTFSNQNFEPFLWTEPARLLDLAQDRLGEDFTLFMSTNAMSGVPLIALPDLKLRVPAVPPEQPFVTRSKLQVTGDLANRRLLVSPDLPACTNAEILSNSVVQLLVGADGTLISATLLKQSGGAEADQRALREAARVRFDSIRNVDPLNPQAGVALGQMIFEWQTLPLPPTNTPPVATPPK